MLFIFLACEMIYKATSYGIDKVIALINLSTYIL